MKHPPLRQGVNEDEKTGTLLRRKDGNVGLLLNLRCLLFRLGVKGDEKMKKLTYTIDELKPHLVNLMFEHLRHTLVNDHMVKMFDEVYAFMSYCDDIVTAIIIGEFNNENDHEESFNRIDKLLQDHNKFLRPNQYVAAHHMDQTEEGLALKKDLGEYIDWMLELRKK